MAGVTGSQLNSIPQFDGATDADVEVLTDNIDAAIITYAWEEHQACGAAKSRLTGLAAKWLRSQGKLARVWNAWNDVAAVAGPPAVPAAEGFKTALKTRFLEMINEIGATNAVVDLKQKPSENVDDFYDRCVLAMDRKNQALAVLEKAYALTGDDAGLNNNLAYLYADMGIKLDKAQELIHKALADRPGEPAYMDSLGWVLYKQGRFAEAKTVFDDVISDAEGRHPIMLDHAGDTCWRLGLKAEAIRLWDRAVKEAKKEKKPGIDTKKVLAGTPRKIKTARKGGKPPIAPLGKGISTKPEDKKE